MPIKNIDNNTKDLYLIVTDVTRFRENISFYILDNTWYIYFRRTSLSFRIIW